MHKLSKYQAMRDGDLVLEKVVEHRNKLSAGTFNQSSSWQMVQAQKRVEMKKPSLTE